jgi:GDP-4-dehydro-6-deoxy-D-mannose reductase
MTALVTGATGALGRILCERLQSASSEQIVRVGRRAQAADGYVKCDVSDEEAVRSLIRRVRPHIVYHLAGSFSNDYETDYAVNARGGRNVLHVLHEEHTGARTVVIGSAAEYGIIRPEENPVREDRALEPVSIYGVTKAFQTHIARHYAYAHRADVVVARLFNLFARGLSDRLFVGRVEQLIERYRTGEAGTIDVGNLNHSRDYVTAEEAVSQIRGIASRGDAGAVYHVASGVPTTMRDLLHQMLDEAGIPRTAVRQLSNGADQKPYDAPVVYADVRRTQALQRVAQ